MIRVPPARLRRTLALTILAVTIAACGGDDESGMSEQACRLIETNGANAFQIHDEVGDTWGTGEEFAANLHDWIQADCPTVLDDPMWQGYFADNNVD